MNNQDFWFPWYPALYQSNTLNLTLEQDGIYRRLIDHYMLTREPLPESHASLARIVGCSIDFIDKNAAAILDAYFTHSDGTYSHKTCDEILDEQDARTIKKSRAGKKAAEKRWKKHTENKEKNAAAITDPMRSDATGHRQDRTGQDSEEERKRENEAVTLYNQTAEKIGIPLMQKLSPTRQKHLRARLKDVGGIEGWKAALEKLEQSSFCKGQNERGWKADFDFLVREYSFIKLMEGKYDGKQRTRTDETKDQLREWAEEPVDG